MISTGSKYDNLEQLLFRGFLVLHADLGGTPVVFKTINTFENNLLEVYLPFNLPYQKRQKQRSAYMIAYSVFLFDQVNVLSDRDFYIPKLVDVILDLPTPVIDRILRRLKFLNIQATKEMHKVQPYTYGYLSRQRWYSYRGHPLNDSRITGISGTSSLGLNMHQKIWTFFNSIDDIKEENDRQWSLTKFQASVHNPKALKKIDAKDADKQRQESRRREEAFKSAGFNKATENIKGEIKVSNESVDDLLTQMNRSLKGQKDFHDSVIEDHENRVQENYLREQARIQAKREEARKNREKVFKGTDASEDPFIFYEEGEVEEQVRAQNIRKAQHLKDGSYRTDRDFAENRERLEKWGIIKSENESNHGKKTKSRSGTIMDDYYRVSEEDLSYPDALDYPDIIGDDDPNKD